MFTKGLPIDYGCWFYDGGLKSELNKCEPSKIRKRIGYIVRLEKASFLTICLYYLFDRWQRWSRIWVGSIKLLALLSKKHQLYSKISWLLTMAIAISNKAKSIPTDFNTKKINRVGNYFSSIYVWNNCLTVWKYSGQSYRQSL